MSRGRKIFAVVLAAVLVATGFGGYRWWHERPPYGPEALEFAATAEQLPSGGRPGSEYHGVKYHSGEGSAAVGGRITWRPPTGRGADWSEDGWFMIFVVDRRVDLMPSWVWGVSTSGHEVVSGGDGVQNRIAKKYPWLRGAGDIQIDDDTWRDGGMALATTPAAGGFDFVAMFSPIPDGDPERRFLAAAPIALSDIMIAVAFVGPDRQVYWAERVYG
ncbi:hypothetical protein [Catellatospora paridis]|uniref:hypothetical protein n=1 Tax=Catellatospora paridis TaxID=1617086 RepID=UPI0012D412BF|nr:hypothetical protein [Catellatospora paridis]